MSLKLTEIYWDPEASVPCHLQYRPRRLQMKACFSSEASSFSSSEVPRSAMSNSYAIDQPGPMNGCETDPCLTHPSVTSPEGVALLELPAVNLPSDLSCASRSFRSRTSARRLRKSERLTRPTVCDFSKSSAEAVWLVNERGVEVRLGSSEGGILVFFWEELVF